MCCKRARLSGLSRTGWHPREKSTIKVRLANPNSAPSQSLTTHFSLTSRSLLIVRSIRPGRTSRLTYRTSRNGSRNSRTLVVPHRSSSFNLFRHQALYRTFRDLCGLSSRVQTISRFSWYVLSHRERFYSTPANSISCAQVSPPPSTQISSAQVVPQLFESTLRHSMVSLEPSRVLSETTRRPLRKLRRR